MMVEMSGSQSTVHDLAKSERYRRVLQYISSTPPRLFFQAIRCTIPSCSCECFLPAKSCLRTCESCKHGWVAHALDKLGYRHVFNIGLQVEIVQPNIVFDIASLMLYGAQATPIRLKILLDRLFSVLQHEEVLQVLHGFGWSYEDYARGYILQETSGRVLDKWMCATREEEFIIMQQFLRFGETKSIAQEIILQDTKECQDNYIKQTTRNDSEIKKFIERSNLSMQNLIRPFDVRHLFGARLPFMGPAGAHLLNPPIPGFTTSSTNARDLRPPLISVTSTSPISTSPLGRLQTMQPFDYRCEPSSPLSLSPREKQRSSPKCDSPQNLSLSSVSVHSSQSNMPYSPQRLSDIESPLKHLPIVHPSVTIGAQSMILPTIPRHSHTEEGVLNFSVKDENDHSPYNDRKNKHLRKSSNPIKRNWIPDPSFGTSMIGPNGKKRVLCTACNKTFCDKGALKIHYSAVHLKEMHKCSVDGCTMMFSSRRSRNRHSANPNPKLHMPQKRPKIPDGARLVDDGSSPSQKRQLSTPPSMIMASRMVSHSPSSHTESPDHRSFYADPNVQMPLFPLAVKRLKLENDDDDECPTDLSLPILKADHCSKENSPDSRSMTLMSVNLLDEEQMDAKESHDVNGDSYSNCSPGTQRTLNRRKNIPTRCAQLSSMLEDTKTAGKTNTDNHIDNYQDSESHSDDESEDINNIESKGKFERKRHTDSDKVDADETSIDKSDSKLVIDDNDDVDDEDIDQNDTGEVLDFAIHMPDGLDMEMSGPESNTSLTSNESESLDSKDNYDGLSDCEIPIDKDNPKQCVTCGKLFLNVFGLKIHFRNVHLKLMHTCTVEGCNVSFPSKRSRDRHSSNLNLHRKLLSTNEVHKAAAETDDNQNFRADIIQKLYENQAFDNDVKNCNGTDKTVKRISQNNEEQNCNKTDKSIEKVERISQNYATELINTDSNAGIVRNVQNSEQNTINFHTNAPKIDDSSGDIESKTTNEISAMRTDKNGGKIPVSARKRNSRNGQTVIV